MSDDFPTTGQRASDADRERTAQLLHEAMGDGRLDVSELDERLSRVYAAKTVAELVPVTADLAPVPVAGAAPDGSWRSRIGATPDGGAMVAVLSGLDRDGAWVVPAEQTVTTILGGTKLDLTHARFEARECRLNVVCVFGGVDIFVPRGLTVRIEGVGVIGAFNSRASQVGDPDAPVLTITGFAFGGAVEVKPAWGG